MFRRLSRIQVLPLVHSIVTTLTTTGYGDIVARNWAEQISAMIIMFCGALFFAFIVGTFVQSMMGSSPAARRADKFKSKMEVRA